MMLKGRETAPERLKHAMCLRLSRAVLYGRSPMGKKWGKEKEHKIELAFLFILIIGELLEIVLLLFGK